MRNDRGEVRYNLFNYIVPSTCLNTTFIVGPFKPFSPPAISLKLIKYLSNIYSRLPLKRLHLTKFIPEMRVGRKWPQSTLFSGKIT